MLAGLANWYGGFRARIMIFAVVFMAVVGWGIPLAWPALHHQPVWATSRTIAALLGLPAHALAGIGSRCSSRWPRRSSACGWAGP